MRKILQTVLLSAKQFAKSSYLLVSFIIITAFINGYLIYNILKLNTYNWEPLTFLTTSQGLSIVIFIFFVYISYEYLGKLKNANLEETVSCSYYGKSRPYISQFVFLFVLIVLVTINILLYDIIAYYMTQVDFPLYLLHIIKNNILNIFLVSVAGSLFGFTAALFFNKFFSYTLMAGIILLVSPLGEFILTPLSLININPYSVLDLFGVLPPDLNWTPDNLYGIPIEPYRWNLVCFWILIMGGGVLIRINAIKNKPLSRFVSLGLIIFATVNFTNYLSPECSMRKDYRTDGYFDFDFDYYRDNEQFEKNADFIISSYDLDFDIDRQLKARAHLKLESKEVPETYQFTLYRNFNVTAIYDENNNELPFTRNGDYLEIQNPMQSEISVVNIEYKGFSFIFYSNRQGIFLPGYFPYYPIAGFEPVYDVDGQSFISIKQRAPTEFTVKVNSAMPVYSNLTGATEKEFSGTAETLTLMGGMIKEYYIGDYTVYASALIDYGCYDNTDNDLNAFFRQNDDLGNMLADFKKTLGDTRDYSFKNKKIIVFPHMYTGRYDHFVYFKDHVLSSTLWPDTMIKVMIISQIPPTSNKQTIKYKILSYLEDSDFFRYQYSDYKMQLADRETLFPELDYDELDEEVLMDMEAMRKDYNNPMMVGGLLLESISMLGEDEALKAVFEYLMDIEDTRDEVTFLLYLTEGGPDYD